MIWLYLQKSMYRPCDLDLWPMKVHFFQWIEYNPISIRYKFQIDISSNSWEIKYQNIGRTHIQTHTQTHRQTDIPGGNNTSQPPPGRGNESGANTVYRVARHGLQVSIWNVCDSKLGIGRSYFRHGRSDFELLSHRYVWTYDRGWCHHELQLFT